MSTRLGLSVAILLLVCACAARPPTIAHVHIGHALTGVHVTPGHKGYLLVAERRAAEALDWAGKAQHDTDLAALKLHMIQVLKATDSADDFGLKQSLILAANHINFAATSPDASANLQSSAPQFAASIPAVIQRCDTISLLAKDIDASHSLTEATVLGGEIFKLADANVRGADPEGSGTRGYAPPDYGMSQLRGQLEAMIARENPPYRTVDEWYLFNLVRLPNGRWVFDKLSRGGNIDGYK